MMIMENTYSQLFGLFHVLGEKKKVISQNNIVVLDLKVRAC